MKRTVLPLVLLALVGCGGEQAITVPVNATGSVAPSLGEVSAQGSASTQDLALGGVATLSKATVQVIQHKSITRPDSSTGKALLVRTCNRSAESLEFSWLPWSMSDVQDQRYPASSTQYDSDPRPVFPNFNGVTASGKCVQGWLVVELAKGVAPVLVQYSNSEGEAVSWKLV